MVTESPCRLYTSLASLEGTLLVGGGSYDTFTFGGQRRPQRAYEQLVLAAFEPDGTTRWLKALGTQWHNRVLQLTV